MSDIITATILVLNWDHLLADRQQKDIRLIEKSDFPDEIVKMINRYPYVIYTDTRTSTDSKPGMSKILKEFDGDRGQGVINLVVAEALKTGGEWEHRWLNSGDPSWHLGRITNLSAFDESSYEERLKDSIK